MYTLDQFREITKHLPGDFEIKIEAGFTPQGNFAAPCFEIITSQKTKEVVLLPQAACISEGEAFLTVRHTEKRKGNGD